MRRLDGKFDVLREVDASGGRVSYEATHPDGRAVRVDWFTVNDPRSRADFHRYRAALKSAGSPLLLDAVARPGTYYSVWLPAGPAPEAVAWLASHPRDEAFRTAFESLAATLADYGFALQDARVVAYDNRSEARPALERLELADRSAEEIATLNRALLGRPAGRPRRSPFAAKAPPPSTRPPGRLGPARGATATATDPPPRPVPRGTAAPARRSEGSLDAIPVLTRGSGLTVQGSPETASSGPARPVSGGRTAPSSAVDTPAAAAPPPATVPSARRLTIWGVLPGLVLLAFAGSRSTAVVQDFLEPPTVSVPKVVDRPLREAVRTLVDRRLTPVTEDGADQTKAPGLILRQDPPADTVLPESRTVVLTVNRPKPLTVPALAGKTLAQARAALAARGLRLAGTATARVAGATGLVVAQRPEADSPTVKNASVTLLLGADPPPKATFLPPLTGLTLEEAKELVALAGLTLVSVRTQPSSRPPGTVLSQSPAPYSRVTVGGDASLRIAAAAPAPVPVRPSPPVEARPTPPEPQPQTPQVVPPPPVPSSPTPTSTATPPTPAAEPAPAPVPAEATPPAPATSPSATPGATEPATPSPTPPASATPPTPAPGAGAEGGETRTVTYQYPLPANRDTATVQVRVADLDGERPAQELAQVPGGTTVSVVAAVRGPATFSLFLDGVEEPDARRTFP